MNFMMTTNFPGSMLESEECLNQVRIAHQAYRSAAPSFDILCSYKVDSNTAVDIVEADSEDEAQAAATAIAEATKTSIDLVPVTPFRVHLRSLRS